MCLAFPSLALLYLIQFFLCVLIVSHAQHRIRQDKHVLGQAIVRVHPAIIPRYMHRIPGIEYHIRCLFQIIIDQKHDVESHCLHMGTIGYSFPCSSLMNFPKSPWVLRLYLHHRSYRSLGVWHFDLRDSHPPLGPTPIAGTAGLFSG